MRTKPMSNSSSGCVRRYAPRILNGSSQMDRAPFAMITNVALQNCSISLQMNEDTSVWKTGIALFSNEFVKLKSNCDWPAFAATLADG